MPQLLILFISWLSITNSIAASPTTEELVSQRLSLMKSVALYKWHKQRPIENLEREQLVLETVVAQGLNYGLKSASVRQFFQVQINAAKEIQHYWFSQWRSFPNQVPKHIPELNRVIRPKLIRLGNHIVETLVNQKTPSREKIEIEGLSLSTVTALQESLLKIEKYSNHLNQIIDTGVLRVGTTGDYAPFSFKAGSDYRGIDIDLAHDLAKSLDVKLIFVETSWPTLMEDFTTGKFDIGMSGISINLPRQRSAFFSASYRQGGKTPIVRCADQQKYNSLVDIDRKGVRFIVNPGGTNQQYLNANIKEAEIIVHTDNRTIFLEIIDEQADVMITDEIEVQLQAKLHKQLCPATPGKTLTFSQKGFLLPQDIVWKEYIDAWLNIKKGDGTLNNIFAKHLN